MELITGAVTVVGAITLIAQTVLYGPLSGKTDTRPPIGERVERWLISGSSVVDRLRESRLRTTFVWGRRLILTYLIVMFVWIAYVSADAAVFDGALPFAEEAPVDPLDALGAILVMAILLPILLLVILGAVVGFYLLQWVVFGILGSRSLLAVALQFMGNHQRQVFAVSGGVTSVFGALTVLL